VLHVRVGRALAMAGYTARAMTLAPHVSESGLGTGLR
jgi:hypothetical protein